VKADRASENIDFISAVLDDGVESNPLPQTEAFKRFVGDIKERCEEPPPAVSASLVGAYNMFS
jgi:hypothetical protein